MASQEVARTMGRGLSRWESYQPSTRAQTAFGELRRVLDQSPAQRRAQATVDTAAEFGANFGGGVAQYLNEQRRGFWDRNFGLSAKKRGEEAQLTEALAALGGLAAGAIARAKVRHDDTRYREAVGRLIWQLVNVAAVDDDGLVNECNEALRWRVLDALELRPQAREQLAASPVPDSYAAITVPHLEDDVRAAVATYAFHASANAIGEVRAAQRVVPLMIRLGMSKSGGEHFARRAQTEYLGESDSLNLHYKTLRIALIGIGRALVLPMDVIAEAAYQATRYNPYEAARAENRQLLVQAVGAASGFAGIGSGSGVSPAMSIVTSAARALFGMATTAPAIENAFTKLGREARVPQATIDGWLVWNRA
ncbi:hypothetical protein [Hamadaea tsunoensis]|uniref:hypothetical protein n=1 Tax=Hamadaea tsunoensis TaxID=53368 RepID=UPI0012F90729|nr:hypothetical protein [Hamadaea tsunoensis]